MKKISRKKSHLLNRLILYPDETLLSWLWRLAIYNHIESPSFLLLHIRNTWPAIFVNRLVSVNWLGNMGVLESLSALTGTSIKAIHQHTVHRFANTLIAPAQAIKWCEPFVVRS
jgi:hypothetical protein